MTESQAKAPTPKAADERGNRRTIIGRVVNETANAGRAKKTVVVEVVRRLRDVREACKALPCSR
jgi:hypothetical protein